MVKGQSRLSTSMRLDAMAAADHLKVELQLARLKLRLEETAGFAALESRL